MFDSLINALLLSCVVASISFFVSHSQLLEKFRTWVGSFPGATPLFIWQLITCCYCLGHWVSAALLLFIPVRLLGIWAPADYALTWLVIAWLAGLQSLAASQLWGE